MKTLLLSFVRVHQDDRQRAGKVHDRLIDLIRSSFPHPRPPFRWIGSMKQFLTDSSRDSPRPGGSDGQEIFAGRKVCYGFQTS